MGRKEHWQTVYRRKAAQEVSWYRPHLETSLALIKQAMPGEDAAILDIGGGASTLVDDLLEAGYSDVTVLDVADTALAVARERLGESRKRVQWLTTDLLAAELEACRYDLCHDRAVFHFLNEESDRAAYRSQVARTLRPGGVLIVATFALDGPERCSGLPVTRYGEDGMRAVFSDGFALVHAQRESHQTPQGNVQEMMYFVLRRDPSAPAR